MNGLHDLYLNSPSPSLWGNAAAIWGEGANPWFIEGIDREEEFKKIFEALKSGSGKVFWPYWEEFREQLADHHPGMPIKGRVLYMMERLLPAM